MNSKDLLSINEAFAKASSKVTADEPAKKDEVVTEDKEIVREDEAAEDVVDDFQPHSDHAAGPEAQPGDQVTVEVPGTPKEVGEVLEIMPDSTLKVATSANPDGVVVDVKYVTPLSDDEAGPEVDVGDEWDDDEPNPWESVMSDYDNNLTSGKYKVREKAATGENFKKPDEKVSEVDSKTQRPKGEVNAEEKSKDVGDVEKDLQKPVEASEEKDEKKPKNEKKLAKESINNCNKGNIMSEDKSIFDKLYESVMGEDDDFELGIPGDDDLGDPGDEFGDEGGDEVTVTLTPDQAAALKAVVDQLPSDEEDPGDDIGADDPLADTDELEDSVHEDHTPTTGAPTSDGKTPGKDPSDGGGKTTDPAPDSLGGKSSGTGDAKVTDDEATTGKPTSDGKKPGDKKHGKPGSQAV